MAIVTGPDYAGAVGKYLDFKQQQNAMKETIRSNKAREQIARDETQMKMELLMQGGTQDLAAIKAGGGETRQTLTLKQRGDVNLLSRQGSIAEGLARLKSGLAKEEMGLQNRYASGLMRLGGTIDKGKIAEEYRHRGALQGQGYISQGILQDDQQAHEVSTIGQRGGLAQSLQKISNKGALDVTHARGGYQTGIANIGATSREKVAGLPYEQRKITKAMAEFMGVPGMEGQSINASTEPTLVAKAMDYITYQNVSEKQTQKLESDILTTSPPTNIPDWSEMDDVINIDEGTTMESLRGFNTSLSTPDPSNMNATPMKRALIGLKSDDKKHHKYGTDLIKQLETNMKHLINPHLRTAFSGNEGEIQVEKQFTKTTLEQLYTAQGLSADSIKTKLLSWDVKEKEKGDVGAVQSAATKARIKTLTRNYSKHPEGSVQAKRIAKKLKTLGIDVE